MKRLLFLILISLALTACTYHGKIRRGLYKNVPADNRVDASILVIADRNIPSEIMITDNDNGEQAFILQTGDGVAVAVTDALATLFTRAEAGSYSIQTNYDYAADVTLESGLTRNNCEGELSKWAVRTNGLCTLLTVTIRRPNEKKAIATAKASAWREFRVPGFASTMWWLHQHSFIFKPLFTPFYMQSQGRAVRQQFEENLKEVLQEITFQLQDKQEVFSSAKHNSKSTSAQNYVE